jgi:hypothetical protein
MLHVADEEGLFRPEVMILENAVDGVPFIGHAGIGLAKEVVHAQASGLVIEVGLVNGAKKKDRQVTGVAVFKDLSRPRQKGDGVVQFPKDLPEDFLQFVEGGVGNVLFVETFVGQVELFPEGLPVEGGFPVGGKDPVGGLQDGGEVVHEGAGPVED